MQEEEEVRQGWANTRTTAAAGWWMRQPRRAGPAACEEAGQKAAAGELAVPQNGLGTCPRVVRAVCNPAVRQLARRTGYEDRLCQLGTNAVEC
jgi:hypothetical protein